MMAADGSDVRSHSIAEAGRSGPGFAGSADDGAFADHVVSAPLSSRRRIYG